MFSVKTVLLFVNKIFCINCNVSLLGLIIALKRITSVRKE